MRTPPEAMPDDVRWSVSPRPRPWIWRIGLCLFLAVAAILAIPWRTPSPQATIDTFIADLITLDPRGDLERAGVIQVSPTEIVLNALPHSQPTVHLLTTPASFAVSFSVSVRRRGAAAIFPFQVKVWDPRTAVAAEAWYSPSGEIMAGVHEGGRWRMLTRLGTYEIGGTDSWRIIRTDRRVTFERIEPAKRMSFEVDAKAFPALVQRDTLSLTVYASSLADDASTAVVHDPIMSVTSQGRYGTLVKNQGFSVAVLVTAVSGLLWLAASYGTRLRNRRILLPDVLVCVLLVGASLFVGWQLSIIPGHPYDERGIQVWSRIGRDRGPAAIPALSLLSTEGHAHGGQPYDAVPFPYPPLLTYVLWATGVIAPSGQTDQVFKLLVMLTVGVGGCLLYGLLRYLRVHWWKATLVSWAYVLNPAIVFDSAVWGQSDAIVALFLLLGAGGALMNSAVLLWTGVLLAILVKQTGILFGAMIVVVGLARLGLGRIVRGLVPAVIIAFLVLTPAFLSGMHPAAIHRPIIQATEAFGALAAEALAPVISQTTFTLWSTVTVLDNVHGLERNALPDSSHSPFGLSYFTLSRVVFSVFALALAMLALRLRAQSPGLALGLIAAYAVGAVLLLTRVSPRYLYFGVMFATAALPWMRLRLALGILPILTGTMLVSLWGMLSLTSAWYPDLLPVFDPSRSWVNGVMAASLSNDTAITMGGLLNLTALVALLVGLWTGHTGSTDLQMR